MNFLLSHAVFYCYTTGIGHAPLLGVHVSQCWHSWPAAKTALLNSSQQVLSTCGCSLSFVPSDEAGWAEPCLANAVGYAVSRSSAANSPDTCLIVGARALSRDKIATIPSGSQPPSSTTVAGSSTRLSSYPVKLGHTRPHHITSASHRHEQLRCLQTGGLPALEDGPAHA